jgi:hypothetical protein
MRMPLTIVLPAGYQPAGSSSRIRDNLGAISQSSLSFTVPSPDGAGYSDQSRTQ